MASCKDCIHFDRCKGLYKFGRLQKTVSKGCPYFKDRSRFVELPVKLGEKVFYFDTAGRIYESTASQVIYGSTGFLIDSDVMFNSNLIGKRFFLTREEAEQALKERENDGKK